MTSLTIHLCGNCEYYQEPHDDYPERGMNECMNCTEWFCDECQKDHAVDCVSKDDLKDYAQECCFG